MSLKNILSLPFFFAYNNERSRPKRWNWCRIYIQPQCHVYFRVISCLKYLAQIPPVLHVWEHWVYSLTPRLFSRSVKLSLEIKPWFHKPGLIFSLFQVLCTCFTFFISRIICFAVGILSFFDKKKLTQLIHVFDMMSSTPLSLLACYREDQLITIPSLSIAITVMAGIYVCVWRIWGVLFLMRQFWMQFKDLSCKHLPVTCRVKS